MCPEPVEGPSSCPSPCPSTSSARDRLQVGQIDGLTTAYRLFGRQGDLERTKALFAGHGRPAFATHRRRERGEQYLVEVTAGVDVDRPGPPLGMQVDRSGRALGHGIADDDGAPVAEDL